MISTPKCADPNLEDGLAGTISSLRSHSINLFGSPFYRVMCACKRVAAHHVVEAETDNGFIFTFEKTRTRVIVQRCSTVG